MRSLTILITSFLSLTVTASAFAQTDISRTENIGHSFESRKSLVVRTTDVATLLNENTRANSTYGVKPADRKFTELLPFVLAAPDQKEAGSCLYMSLTGIAEWWIAKLNPNLPRTSDGPLDLSERWVLNTAGDERYMTGVREWKTDSIYLFNNVREIALNTAYRFTMGWFTGKFGSFKKAKASTRGAQYGELYNWIDERELAGPSRFKMPTFSREVLFADPDSNQWNVGSAPAGLVDKIKLALVKNRAPVQLIYNHTGFWHATMIVGFDDSVDTKGCALIAESRKVFREKAEAETSSGRTYDVSEKLEAAVAKHGACNAKGVFYVRDSIYGLDQPAYVYDPSNPAKGTGQYSAKIVELEYSFVTLLANHAIQISAASN